LCASGADIALRFRREQGFYAEAILISEQNVELARDLFEQWSARNYEFLIKSARPDVEIFSRFASLGGEPFRGPEGVRQWVAEIEQSFGRFKVRVDRFLDLGDDRVLALGAIDLEGKASGVGIDQPMGWLLELRDEKLVRMLFYSSHAEAREAAGLTQQDDQAE
jgi:ketosteroid isomerase-like protein